jgi:hypothetical protein
VFESGRYGGLVEAVDRIQHVLQPEALYEFVEDGQRTVFAVFDMADPSQIPVLTEPPFNLAKAKITLTPCMTVEDIKKGVEEATRRMSSMERLGSAIGGSTSAVVRPAYEARLAVSGGSRLLIFVR